MYHEEKEINGVLCFRHTPNGQWEEYTPEQLLLIIKRLKQEILKLICEIGDRDE